MIDDDLLDQRQPQPSAPLLRREERVEDAFQIRLSDAGPRIAHPNRHPPPLVAYADLQPLGPFRPGIVAHRLARVAHQVDERLPDLAFVGRNLGKIRLDCHVYLDAVLHELAAREIDDRGHHGPEIFDVELGARQAREPEVSLRDLGETIDLADDGTNETSALFSVAADLVAEQLRVETDRCQRVSDLVGDLRGHSPHRGQPFRPNQPLLALLNGGGHGVELASQVADLVVRGHARALGVVASRHLPRPRAKDPEWPQGAQREDEGGPHHR